mmetsp:Transcript_25936/g.32338  ORF Transcript_25936/g.32338 Transcript_25936/m.32338 type:complete len:639 (-) Transcript_25936:58-1974(-)
MMLQELHGLLGKLDEEWVIKKNNSPKIARGKGKKRQSKKIVQAKGVGFGGNCSDNMTKIISRANDTEKQKDSSIQRILMAINQKIIGSDEFDGIVAAFSESRGFAKTFIQLLQNGSLIDIGCRNTLYQSVLNIISTIMREPFLALFLEIDLLQQENCENTVLGDQVGQNDNSITCKSLLNDLAAQASIFASLHQRNPSSEENIESALIVALHIIAVNDECGARIQQAYDLGMQIPSQYLKTTQSAMAGKKRKDCPRSVIHRRDLKRIAGPTSSVDDRRIQETEESRKYVKLMKLLRFKAICLVADVLSGNSSHQLLSSKPGGAEQYIKSSSGHDGVLGNANKWICRVGSEISSLVNSLPVEYGSSIFVRCDEDRMDILKALIIGPEDSPYANGCFEFDILLPGDYPQRPPEVKFVTTGGGTVRFNPNLYQCGKVCLSLLGTWQGPGWDPQTSSLLQVLVSIQSLIFVPDPYFNEPGYERDINTVLGKKRSENYNNGVRRDTLCHAILDQINGNESSVFNEVILKHFQIKRRKVIEQLGEWEKKQSVLSFTANEIRRILGEPRFSCVVEGENVAKKHDNTEGFFDLTGDNIHMAEKNSPPQEKNIKKSADPQIIIDLASTDDTNNISNEQDEVIIVVTP